MAAYTPPVISPTDSLDPSTVKDGFDDYATAINGAVDVANIGSASLGSRQFHKNSLTELWKFSNRGLSASAPVRFNAAGAADTTIVQVGRTFGNLNTFDVEDLWARVYVQHEADLWISAQVDMRYAKSSPVSTVFVHRANFSIVVDGVPLAPRPSETREAGNGRNPLKAHNQLLKSSVAAGWHDVGVRISFRASTASTGIDEFAHWIMGGRSLNIFAQYR